MFNFIVIGEGLSRCTKYNLRLANTIKLSSKILRCSNLYQSSFLSLI